MKSERGSITIWMLGLSVVLMLFGGIAVDLWRALDLQRELAAVADSAAVAAASGIDEARYRATGEIILDPARASELGNASISHQGVTLTRQDIVVSGDGASVTVDLGTELRLGLLGLFVHQSEPLEIGTTATARPLLVSG